MKIERKNEDCVYVRQEYIFKEHKKQINTKIYFSKTIQAEKSLWESERETGYLRIMD